MNPHTMIANFPAELPITELELTGSTNADALALAQHTDAPYWLLVARRQTEGRGRRGRSWQSDDGNVFATLLVRMHPNDGPITGLVFVAALAMWRTVRDALPMVRDVRIKWPNDILIDSRKVAGALIETTTGDHGMFAAIGVGINVASHPIAAVLYPTTCLAACGSATTRHHVVASLANNLLSQIELWRQHGFASLRHQYLPAAYGLGRTVSIAGATGAVSGTFVDVTETAIVLRNADGSQLAISAGDIVATRSVQATVGVGAAGSTVVTIEASSASNSRSPIAS